MINHGFLSVKATCYLSDQFTSLDCQENIVGEILLHYIEEERRSRHLLKTNSLKSFNYINENA